MAYNTKLIVTDLEGNPISQYYNKELDQYEPVEGQAGANKVVLYNADGTENNNLSLIPILEKLSQLTGTVIDEDTRKSNEIIRQDNEQLRVQLYNDLMAQLDRIEQIQEQVPETVVDSINDIRDKLGDLTLLDTAEKSNLVLALNEIYQDLIAHKAEKATQTQLGHVKVDDETIVIDENGVISGSQTAIVESGSNENGHYIRFIDGTQICYHRINDANINITELTDTLYRSSAQTWVLPAQFITINAASVYSHTPFGWATVSGTMSQTLMPFRLFATREITDMTILYLFAIGRWK